MGDISRVNNYDNFKNTKLSNEKYFYKDKYIIKLLILYMANNDNENANKLMKDIINKKCELNKNLCNADLVNLLYISELLNLTDYFLKSYPEYSIYGKSEVEDLKIFSIYRDYLNRNFSNLNYVLKIIEINNFKLLDNNLRIKVNRLFSKKIKETNIKKEIIQNKNNFKKFDEYYLLQNNNFNCLYDKSKLINTKVKLARYNGVTGEIKDYVATKAYLCTKCNTMYLIDAYIKEINTNYGNSILKRIENKELEKTSINYVKEGTNFDLRSKSFLSEYGYSTTLSKETRYKILKNNIIPKIGIDKTIWMLGYLINHNGKSSKQKRALSEWKYDMNLLEKEYRY
ncbi:hypothetical protein [Clostridium sp.]|uniref:hypothetical protein n=1 Tax=Clostridium sp. TaxID=1506 RepID=UPI001D6D85FB|nr:hypothetical protein [Clostridium sp.]MBS5937606.1 hypothetical protein [Clostridium sp.]